MSIFNELLPKILEISNSYSNNYQDVLKDAYLCFDKWEEDFLKEKARDKPQKDINVVSTLQSINEDENESTKSENERTSSESSERGAKKRSKHEVEGMESPEQEKRQKRNASVKAQSIISKQVNVNLTQKLRRENSTEKNKNRRGSREDDKENTEPALLVRVKEEKVSLPPEPMEVSSALEVVVSAELDVKQEVNKDDIAMPPPTALPKPRKAVQKDKSEETSGEESSSRRRTTRTRRQMDTQPAVQKEKSIENSEEEVSGRRGTTRTRKQTDTLPTQPGDGASDASRRTRSSRRHNASAHAPANEPAHEPAHEPADSRPKRTRAKKTPQPVVAEVEKENQTPVENESATPAEKLKPKRTRKAQRAEEKEITQIEAESKVNLPQDEGIVETQVQSPVLQMHTEKRHVNIEKSKRRDLDTKTDRDVTDATHKTKYNNDGAASDSEGVSKLIKNENGEVRDGTNGDETKIVTKSDQEAATESTQAAADETRVLSRLNCTVTISKDLDSTVVLPGAVYDHTPLTPKDVRVLDATMVLTTAGAAEAAGAALDATVVLDKAAPTDVTDDNSLLTDDSDAPHTPPRTPHTPPPRAAPASAVKERVQQFEQLATRTKTRAMAKKEDQPEEQTPADKSSKAVLSSETLTKMNSMIFNGKPPQMSNSASKPRVNIATSTKSHIPTSTSKLSGINKAREAEELRREREDARKKKEAMLEAKRELQKKKREDKMAAAAAAREAAERERRAAMEAAARERMEKQAQADHGRQERLKEAERKKQDLARKVAETEERRRAEEQARQQRLADEQRRAEVARRKQLEDAELFKKEAALMQREIERKQKEFLERQRIKQRMDGEKILTPYKCAAPYPPPDPVYMADGFQYLNSDEDEDEEHAREVPHPAWSLAKARRAQLARQARVSAPLVDRLFSVRAHSPDLREIFPAIERARLKRTSSAVWRTPPRAPPHAPRAAE